MSVSQLTPMTTSSSSKNITLDVSTSPSQLLTTELIDGSLRQSKLPSSTTMPVVTITNIIPEDMVTTYSDVRDSPTAAMTEIIASTDVPSSRQFLPTVSADRTTLSTVTGSIVPVPTSINLITPVINMSSSFPESSGSVTVLTQEPDSSGTISSVTSSLYDATTDDINMLTSGPSVLSHLVTSTQSIAATLIPTPTSTMTPGLSDSSQIIVPPPTTEPSRLSIPTVTARPSTVESHLSPSSSRTDAKVETTNMLLISETLLSDISTPIFHSTANSTLLAGTATAQIVSSQRSSFPRFTDTSLLILPTSTLINVVSTIIDASLSASSSMTFLTGGSASSTTVSPNTPMPRSAVTAGGSSQPTPLPGHTISVDVGMTESVSDTKFFSAPSPQSG